jgi:UDP-N-acetylglucosamine 1-carboxyvinyltransferase
MEDIVPLEKIFINGGRPLEGKVRISGSKNAALAIMAGAVLVDGKVVLKNIPRITDTLIMVELLNGLGAATRFVDTSTVEIDASNIHCLEAPYELVRKMRASFSVLGPLLARFGFARVPVPGGCDIGARPVNFHIEGLKHLGAILHAEHGVYSAQATKLHGSNIYFDFQSAGATQHLMTAACLAEGDTTIENCAVEPEVVDLANFLNTLGANVEGAGTTTIKVHGVNGLHGGEYSVISDRMEAGTFAIAAGMTCSDILIDNILTEHMKPVLSKLSECGIHIQEEKTGFRVHASGRPRAVNIKTMPHPGFPTDMHQPFAALLSIADGTSMIIENVYESRFRYVNELNRMGANIEVEGRTAVITGVPQLTGAPVAATDLRAGAAMVCAGLAADGETEISSIEHIDRGYEDFIEKLQGLGADISRGNEEKYGGLRVCSL